MPYDQLVVATLRAQAWERAKGELNSVLCTYYGSINKLDSDKYKSYSSKLEAFIKDVEDNGLTE